MVTFTGVCLNFDGVPDCSGEILDENTGIELPSDYVPVVFEFIYEPKFKLGRAKLSFDLTSRQLRYEMELDDSEITKDSYSGLTPCVGGILVSREGNKVTHVKIASIGLTERDNQDSRILPLGAQT